MKHALFDCRMPESFKQRLEALGFCTIGLPHSPILPEATASHTDMLIFMHGKSLICTEEYISANPELRRTLMSLPDYELIISASCHKAEYPFDAILNALPIGDKLFLRQASICPDIIYHANQNSLELINVKQGYPRCTVLALDKTHAITADRGMHRAMTNAGIDVTLISDTENILLKPHKYGFIGGCAGVYRDTVYFAGDIKTHPDCDKIVSAIEALGMRVCSLGEDGELLLDLGGIFFCG